MAATKRRQAQKKPAPPAQIQPPGPDFEFNINGHSFKLNGHLPLTWGDWVDLENKGISPGMFETEGRVQLRAGEIFVIASHIIQKACPEVTTEEIRAIKLGDMTIQKVMAAFEEAMLKEAESLSIPS